MDFLSGLKSFLSIKNDLSGLKTIVVKFLDDNKDNSFIRIDKSDRSRNVSIGTITVNLASDELSDAARKKLAEHVKQTVLGAAQQPILEESAASLIADFAERESDPQDADQQMFEFFKDKIPSDDVPILRGALYISSLYNRGHSVAQLRRDLIEQYGRRGGNISNLCSAGYFESHLKPMYETMATSPGFVPQKFVDAYEVIVDGVPFAVFVAQNRRFDDLVIEVEKKLLTNKKYGIKQMNLHAIGAQNVGKLQSLLQHSRITSYFTNEPAITSQHGVMNVQIFF